MFPNLALNFMTLHNEQLIQQIDTTMPLLLTRMNRARQELLILFVLDDECRNRISNQDPFDIKLSTILRAMNDDDRDYFLDEGCDIVFGLSYLNESDMAIAVSKYRDGDQDAVVAMAGRNHRHDDIEGSLIGLGELGKVKA
jgi:hypothetical protein